MSILGDSWLARKARAILRNGPGFAIEVIIFWAVLELFQQLNYGGRIITGPQSTRSSSSRSRSSCWLSARRKRASVSTADLEGGRHPRRDRDRLCRHRSGPPHRPGQLGAARRLPGLPARRAHPRGARGADGHRRLRLLPRLLSRTPATGSRLVIVASSASHPAVKELAQSPSPEWQAVAIITMMRGSSTNGARRARGRAL